MHTPARKGSLRYTRANSNLPEFEMIQPPPSRTSQGSIPHSPCQDARRMSDRQSRLDKDPVIGQEKSTTEVEHRLRPRRPTITIPIAAHVVRKPVAQVALPTEMPLSLPPPPPPPPKDQGRQTLISSPRIFPLPMSAAESQNSGQPLSSTTTVVQSSDTPVMNPTFQSCEPGLLNRKGRNGSDSGNLSYSVRIQALHNAKNSTHAVSQTPQIPKIINMPRRTDSLIRDKLPQHLAPQALSPVHYSSPGELTAAWELARGHDLAQTKTNIILELACGNLTLNREEIQFLDSQSKPLYSLCASTKTDFTVIRFNPNDMNEQDVISAMKLTRPSQQDPLVTSIFPLSAGTRAKDRVAASPASATSTDAIVRLVTTNALREAQDRETSMLLWDYDSDKYCILHPTLLDQVATCFRIRIAPDPSFPQRIIVYAPESTDVLLLDLDISALALHVNMVTIMALPSLYLLDTLISALLCLLLHLHRQCGEADPNTPYQSAANFNSSTSNLLPNVPPVAALIAASRESPPEFFPPPPKHPCSSSKRTWLTMRRDKNKKPPTTTASSASLKSRTERDIEMGKVDVQPDIMDNQMDEDPFADSTLPRPIIFIFRILYRLIELFFRSIGLVFCLLRRIMQVMFRCCLRR